MVLDDHMPEWSVELPIDGTLDLHTFKPRDLGALIPEYLDACMRKGIYEVRIIHGKGEGILQRSVHVLLDRIPQVVAYQMADELRGGWGATLVQLDPTAE